GQAEAAWSSPPGATLNMLHALKEGRAARSSGEAARPPRLHHLLAGEMQPFGHEPGESFDQLVAEARIGFAPRANRPAVEVEHLRVLVRSRLKRPRTRRDQP